MPSRLTACGRDQPVAEQVQPQLHVVRCRPGPPAGRRRRRGPPAAHAAHRVDALEPGQLRRAPPGRRRAAPSRGAGNQVSSTAGLALGAGVRREAVAPRGGGGVGRVGGVSGCESRCNATEAGAVRRPDPLVGWTAWHRPDLRPRRTLTADLVDIESVSGDEQRSRTPWRRRCAALRPPRGAALRQHRGGPHRARARRAGRDRRPHRHGAGQRQPAVRRRRRRRSARARHLRHEGRRRGRAAARRHAAGDRTATSPTSSTSARRSRPSATACSCSSQSDPDLLAGRLRGPDGALRRGRRGRLPGHPAGRRHHPRRPRPLRAVVDRASTPSTAPARCSPG